MIANGSRYIVARLTVAQPNIHDLADNHLFQRQLRPDKGHRAHLPGDIQLQISLDHATCAFLSSEKTGLPSGDYPIFLPRTSASQCHRGPMTEKLSQNELLSLTTEIVASHLS